MKSCISWCVQVDFPPNELSLKFHYMKQFLGLKHQPVDPSKATSFGLTSLCKHTFEVGKGEEMMLVVSYLVIEHGSEEISYYCVSVYHISVFLISMLVLLHLYGFAFLIVCFSFTSVALYFFHLVYHILRLCHILLHYIVYIISKHTVSENPVLAPHPW